MSYVYRYTQNDQPLKHCPDCGGDLTIDGSVDITLSTGGHVFDILSSLDENGVLMDTEDGAVAAGFHSSTSCSECGEQLIDMAGVEEDSEYDG